MIYDFLGMDFKNHLILVGFIINRLWSYYKHLPKTKTLLFFREQKIYQIKICFALPNKREYARNIITLSVTFTFNINDYSDKK
jgi:hypothetical protein